MKLTPAAQLILLLIRMSESPVTYKEIEKRTELHHDTVADHIKDLVRENHISRVVIGRNAYFSSIEREAQ